MSANDKTFGIINPWPGSMSAEFEVIERIKRTADECGFKCIVLSNQGYILDESQKLTSDLAKDNSLDFIITTHFDTPKMIDTFYYHTLWNPPEIPLNLVDYNDRISNNYIMNDDFLVYDNGKMSVHLECILMNSPRNLEKASMLVASFPKSAICEPQISRPLMFYCGMNWEKVVHGNNRHEGLFKKLDKTGCIKFFGPDKNPSWGGIAPWEGYDCYQKPIPFDGFSILDEIRKCGVVLVLSSDIHRNAGAATNRVYEACAAGAVIISDENPFMIENFKSAALFIKYDKHNPENTFNQIMKHYNWIQDNEIEALELAKRAQDIFLKKYTLDNQLERIYDSHCSRVEDIGRCLGAFELKEAVLVVFLIITQNYNEAIEQLDCVVQNIRNQTYKNIILKIACDITLEEHIRKHMKTYDLNYSLWVREIFDELGQRVMFTGQLVKEILSLVNCSYFTITSANDIWFKDHISTLLRSFEDNLEVSISYSGRLVQNSRGARRVDFFGLIDLDEVLKFDQFPSSGQMIFKSSAAEHVPAVFYQFLDRYEHYAFFIITMIKRREKIKFTKRMSFVYLNESSYSYDGLYEKEYQQRLIYDYIKYDIEYSSSRNRVNTRELLANFPISEFPFKAWMKHKYYRFVLSMVNPRSKVYSIVVNKYKMTKEDLEEAWRKICI